MVLSVKYFLAQELITEMKYPYSFPDLAPSDFWLFSKINSNLKRWKFQDTEDIHKKVTAALKDIPQ